MTNWHEEYRKRYKQLKESGKPFFPYAVFRDTLISVLILAVLLFLAWHFGAKLEDIADPTDSSYNPRPEWYFLFLFQVLKYFPGHLEAVAAIILPGLGLLVLVLLPFLDRGPARHPFDRPLWTSLGLLSIAGFIYLTWEGYRSPMTNVIAEKDPLVLEGRILFQNLNCAYCHKVNGKGGNIGPELDKVGTGDEMWLEQHLRDPQAAQPDSTMPKMNLLEDEIKALSAYLRSLGGAGPYTDNAPLLFAENCAACHRFGKEGGDLGPDLSLIGTMRNYNYIKSYVSDPSYLNADSTMPGYRGQLSGTDIEDISRYLTWTGTERSEEHPLVEISPTIKSGRRLFRSLHCAYCHKIGGHGGEIGPELDNIVPINNESVLRQHFRDPQSINPRSIMPKMELSEDDISALIAYMKDVSLSSTEKNGSVLFQKNCSACHAYAGQGGRIGPDLFNIGATRKESYIRDYILVPKKRNPRATMLGFKGSLSDTEIDQIVLYLTSQTR